MTSALWGRAFLSLLARPASLWFGVAWVATTLLVAEYALRIGSWLLMSFAAPVPTGLLAAQFLIEVQHTTFAWTLPRIGRAMAAPLIALALAGAAAMALWLVPSVGFSPSSAPAAFAFLGFWCGVVLFDPVHGWRNLAPLGAAVAVWAWADREVAASGALGAAAPLAACGVAAWCIARTFSRDALRRRPAKPTLTFTNSHLPNALARYRRDKMASSRTPSARVWRREFAESKPWTGILASFYERQTFGQRPIWNLLAHGLFLATVLVPLSGRPLVWAWNDWATHVYNTFVVTGPRYHLVLAFIVTAVTCGPFGTQPAPRVGLSPWLHHPLSRSARARLMWQTHWLTTAVVGSVTVLLLTTLSWAAVAMSGTPLPEGRLPGFIPPLLFALSMVPFQLWRDTRAEWRNGVSSSPALWAVRSFVFAIALLTVVTTVSTASAHNLAGVHPVVQIAGWALWLAAMLGLHRWLVMRRFTSGDLL